MSCPGTALSEEDIRQRLGALPAWQFRENTIERVYSARNYLEALDKLNAVARLSEKADHHPDLTLSWKRLIIRYWTHVAGGVTELDFELATQVEQALAT